MIQLDSRAEHIGRRTAVVHPLVGDARATLSELLPLLAPREPGRHLQKAQESHRDWMQAQHRLAEPGHDESLLGRLRSKADNPDALIRPEAVAVAIDRHAGPDTIFTTDTGMSTVWLARLVPMSDRRRLIGSYNLGSMANAMPMALGAQALDRSRQVSRSAATVGS